MNPLPLMDSGKTLRALKNGLRQFSPSAGGFSLIEVVIAIGVLTFAIVPIVGLMPHGYQTLHVAIRQNAEAQIQQEILGRLNTADWNESASLASFHKSSWYFNDHGAPVTNSGDAIYTAYLEVSDFKLPGAAASNDYLRTVTMKVTDLPGAVRPFENPARYRRYVTTVAKMDK